MSMVKRMMEEKFMDDDGNFPEDFGMCSYCGYVGVEWINHICPKCKKKSIATERVEKNRQEFTNKLRSNKADEKIRGEIGEWWVATKYRNQGYEVVRTTFYNISSGKTILNEGDIERILEKYENKDRILNLVRIHFEGFPDFIMFKDNKISFVEVKSNNSSVKENQMGVMKILKELGYEVFVEQVILSYNVESSERIELEQLEKKKHYTGEIYFKKK
ncbi:VRR-NUC domain-containing protein [Candidatus Pacearchaeota archaeon]|nr:VRR-NUC domain-containing protein [Candidatus Pacearchaeota archaeon]